MGEPIPEPGLLAVAALDELVAQLVAQAHEAGLRVPGRFFDWIAADATLRVEMRARDCLPAAAARSDSGLATALRCGVRAWLAPAVVVRFPELRPLFPELEVRSQASGLSVLVRTGRWRCSGADPCGWQLCEPPP